MNPVVFSPGRVGPLPAYLGYLFLRFPGTLGAEESWDLECLDTYDRRWSRLGQVWVRRNAATFLVQPPSLIPLEGDRVSAFGLQKPQLLGRLTVKVRSLEFADAEGESIQGQVVKVRARTYLVLAGRDHSRWKALIEALVTDGLELFPAETEFEPLVKDRGPGFAAPMDGPSPQLDGPAVPFLLEQLKDGLRMARQYEKGVRDDIDTECLHQYRVYLRRVRSLASLGKMWELIPEWNRLKTVLRTLQQNTNELRDLDVLLIDFPELQNLLPWEEGPRLEGWHSVLVKRRSSEFRRVKAWLESDEHRFASGEVDKLLADLQVLGEPWTVADLAASAFSKSAHSLQKSLKALGTDPADEALHEVRIQAKRLRYVLDALGGLGASASVKSLIGTLKESQEGLGRFQDQSLLLERLKNELAALRAGPRMPQPGGTFDPLTFGLLVGILVGDQPRRKALALKDSARLGSKTFLKALARLADPRGGPDGP